MPAPNHDVTTTASAIAFTTSNVGYSSSTNLGQMRVRRDILTTVSVNTPHWGELKKWAIPINSYNKLYWLLSDPIGTMGTTRRMYSPPPTGTAQYYDTIRVPLSYFGSSVDPSSDSYQVGTFADDPDLLAVSRLQSDIRQGNAQTGVFLAESGKTAAHLAHTATRVYKALKALKKCRFGEFTSALGITTTQKRVEKYYSGVRVYHGSRGNGFKYDSKSKFSREEQHSRFSDFAAQTWLEYSYGWKPLIKDVYDHAVALENIATRYGLVMRKCISTAKTVKEKSWTVNVAQNRIIVSAKTNSLRRERICVEFRLPTGIVDVTNTFGLSDPLSVAWEVVPFSFIVDWFIPIGNFLEGISTYNSLVFHRGYKTISHKYSAKNTAASGPFIPNWAGDSTLTINEATFKNSFDSFGFRRDLLASFPSTPFPKFKDPRSIAHGISAVALLKTLFIPSNGVRRL
jgi:hypothetical protein